MRPLPETFSKGGFEYTLIERDGMAAIYRQSSPGTVQNCFEVGRIRRNAARIQFGIQIEAAESWPSSEEWGVRAWTYTDLGRAKQRLATLIPANSANPEPAQD